MKKRFLSIVLVAASLIFCGCAVKKEPIASTEPVASYEEKEEDENTPESEPMGEAEPEAEKEPEPTEFSVGGFTVAADRLTVTGGSYEQDGNPDNGPETISWKVLNESDGVMVLISECVLDMVPYNSSYEGTDWDNSYVKAYLNGDFYNSAFTDAEKEIMIGEEYFVSLLSFEEVKALLPAEEDRMSQVTEYAKEKGVFYIDEETYELFGYKEKGVSEAMIGCGNYWLKDNGPKLTEAMDVGASGIIRETGHDVGSKKDGIRPVIVIKIS